MTTSDADRDSRLDLRVLTRPLGGSPLARAAVSGALSRAWFVPRPDSPEAWRAAAREVATEFAGRDWLSPLLPALGDGASSLARLRRVREGGGVLVTTGQQPGLFGGPIYTWSKALSALALADAIEAHAGVPAAPLFWAATDDADFAEASVTYVAVSGGVETLELPEPKTPGASMRDTPLGDVRSQLTALARGAGSSAYAEVLELTRRAYAPGETVGSAYLRLLRALLEPLGIPVLDAGHPALRVASREVTARALRCAAQVGAALEARERELDAAGYRPQVALVRGLSLVFESRGGTRERVSVAAAPAAAERASSEPGAAAFGPNVLLRPVLERAILPTVTYVAGPGEISYFAQATAVARALELTPPRAVARWSGTIVEPHVSRILARYDLAPDDFRDPHTAETRLVRDAVPPRVTGAIERLRQSVSAAVTALSESLRGPDAPDVPDAVSAGLRRDLEHRIARVERRIVAAAKRRESALLRDLATARGALYPFGKPQERVLNAIPILARHGPSLFDAMLSEARRHAARVLGETSEADDGASLHAARPGASPDAPQPTAAFD